jgi:cyclophilin family peptidyl-prolyl cis-trans isomerase
MSHLNRAHVVVLVALVAAACSGAAASPSPSISHVQTASPGGGGGPTTATIETPLGNIVIALSPKSAPIATANFVKLTEAGYYQGVVFHRLVPGFIIQTGDGQYGKTGAYDAAHVGQGGPGYTIKDEPVLGDYVRGVVAMARTRAPDSQGSQFFICLADLTERLDKAGGYVIFGRVISGMEVVDAIAAGPNGGGDANLALEPVPMIRVTISQP